MKFLNPSDKIRDESAMPDRIALSFFSGAMGLDLGLGAAGLTPLLASDIDKYCRATILANNPEIGLIGDITFTTASLLKAASFLLLPHSVQSLVAPHALPMPTRWAPVIALTGSRSRRSLAPLPLLTAVSTDSITANLTSAHSITLNACNALDPHISCHPLPPASLMPIDEGIVREGDSLHD